MAFDFAEAGFGISRPSTAVRKKILRGTVCSRELLRTPATWKNWIGSTWAWERKDTKNDSAIARGKPFTLRSQNPGAVMSRKSCGIAPESSLIVFRSSRLACVDCRTELNEPSDNKAIVC